ncbi:YtxH domain-containing protein [Neobacillus niacini]|uniref:YtxH domain-containing protein n=1 Tax=Neobacillus niacini TaxID=86668 RepID=UPI0021CAE8E3|nr:YtxH domain-containing protein [Neobacillus niacini]MCM3764995.1 YtxH domain-containing protein [Neobacillus niacini]
MTRKNQFWKGMLFGALAGGAVTLLDKETREAMKEHVKRVSGVVSEVVRHPGEMAEKVKGTATKLKTTFEQVGEDISFIVEKVDELRELTPKVTDAMKETKESLSPDDELLEELLEEKEYR